VQRFCVSLNEGSFRRPERTPQLAVHDFDISKLRASERNLFQLSESVRMKRVYGGCKNIVPDMVGVVGVMNSLTFLSLEHCQEIEYIFDATSVFGVDLLVPKFAELHLKSLENLKELCRGSPLQVLHFFEKISILVISKCWQLKNLFPPECQLRNLTRLIIKDFNGGQTLFSMSVAQSMELLEGLNVKSSHELKNIIGSEEDDRSNTDN